MFYYYELALDDDLYIDFADLLKKALGLLGAKKKLVDLVWTDKKSNRIEDLVNKYEIKTQINSTANYSSFLPVFAFQPSVTMHIPTTYCSISDSRPADNKINQFTKIIQSLALSIRTLQSRVDISRGNPRAAITSVNSSPS